MTEINRATAEAGQEFLRKLAASANAEPAFRRQLETDPAAACSTFGVDLPAGVRFVCAPATPETAAAVAARSTESEIHIPIVEEKDGALSDDQLEGVSGGVAGIDGDIFGKIEWLAGITAGFFSKQWQEKFG